MGIFNDALSELTEVAEVRFRRRCRIAFLYCPDDPPAQAWACWVEDEPQTVAHGDSGHAAMSAALQTLRSLAQG